MSTSVILPYDPQWRALEWAKEHCPSYITNTVGSKPVDNSKLVRGNGGWVRDFGIEYFFEDERDAVLFILRWA